MRYFTLAAFASLTFGIFCSAAPTPGKPLPVDLPPVPVAARDTTLPTGNSQTLRSVLTVATSAVNPLADRVANLHTVDAIEDVLGPILQQLVDILDNAVNGVQKLADVPIEDSLIDITTGVLFDVRGIVQLIVPLIRVVLVILKNVVNLVGGTVTGDVLPLVTQIAALLAKLLAAILILVGDTVVGVVAGVLSLIGDLIPFIMTLNVQELLSVLGISP